MAMIELIYKKIEIYSIIQRLIIKIKFFLD